MMRSNQASIVANPVLIGTATVLVTIVAVFLAYSANNGLPFVQRYNVDAIVSDADLLGHNAEVRIGGKRVGIVSDMQVVKRTGGPPVARLKLALDFEVGPLPDDTLVRVRPKSVIGLKYLQLIPGDSKRTIAAGGTIPMRNERTNVDLQDALNAFGAGTRKAMREATIGLGDAFAGRGPDLSAAIRGFPPLLDHLEPVMRNLASVQTDLRGLFRGLDAASGAVEPVSRLLPRLFDGAATTLQAVAEQDDAFGQVIEDTPTTERVAVSTLRSVDPVLKDATELAGDLRPGLQALPPAATSLADAAEAGTPVLRRAIALANGLEETLGAARTLIRDPATPGSVTHLARLLDSLLPTLEYLVPAQTRCNLLGLYGQNAGPTIGEGDENGNWFRFLPLQNTPDNPYKGRVDANLHMDPYVENGQNGRCVAGNEKYEPGKQVGPPPNAATAPTSNPVTRPPADALGVGG